MSMRAARAACLDENEALAISLNPSHGPESAERAHLEHCDACRQLIAAVLKIVDGSGRTSPGWRCDHLDAGVQVGAYRVLGTIGQGAMGTVYLAVDDRLDRRVAIKIMGSSIPDDAAMGLVQAEARTMARLRHPNVVEVLDVGISEHGPFIAMEYIEGSNLRAWLRETPRSHGEIRRLLAKAGCGLGAIHAAGIVHCDFKPANVLVGRDGRVKVADFGLARLRGDARQATAPDRVATRRDEALVGTPVYMAPEQFTGSPLGPAADQFAFCVTMFEALTGCRPFPNHPLGERLAAISAGRTRPARRPIPRGLEQSILVGLRADAGARFADMNALLRAIRPARGWSVVGLVALLLVMLGGVFVLTAGPTTPGLCRVDSSPLAWEAADKAHLRRQWSSRDVSPRASDRLSRWLDGYAQRWGDAYARACGSTRADPSIALDRLVCLRGLRRDFDVFVERAASAEVGMTEGFTRAARRLRSVESCTGRRPPAPEDSQWVASTRALRMEYVAAHTRGATAELRRLRPRLAAAAVQAEHDGLHGVQAELLLVVGTLDVERGAFDVAGPPLEYAYLLAQVAGRDDLAFDAALGRSIVVSHQGDRGEAWRWARHAEAALAMLDDGARAANLAIHEGYLHADAASFVETEAASAAVRGHLGDPLPRGESTSAGAAHRDRGATNCN